MRAFSLPIPSLRSRAATPGLLALIGLLLVGSAPQAPAQVGPPACGNGDSPDAERAASAYALAVVALRTDDRALRLAVLDGLKAPLLDAEQPEVVQTACAEALGMAAEGLQGVRERVTALRLAEELLPVFRDARRPRLTRAVLPVSLARLLADFEPASSARASLTADCVALVQERGADPAGQVGAVQALGLLVRAGEGRVGAAVRALADAAEDHPKAAVRPLALVALGQIIGRLGWAHPSVEGDAVPTLLACLRDGDVTKRAWAALALGVAADETARRDPTPPPAAVIRALHRALNAAADDQTRAACALALALMHDESASVALRQAGLDAGALRPLPGSLQAIGLLGDRAELPTLAARLRNARLDAAGIEATGVALALLGARDAWQPLLALLDAARIEDAAAPTHALRNDRAPDAF